MPVYAEDYPVGSRYDIGLYTISEREIVSFAQLYDPQPYHLSQEGGAKSSFGGLIASGWNVASIWMKLYVTNMLENAAVEGSPGVDELRFLKPVRPGDQLKGTAEILGSTPSLTQRGVVTLRKKGILANKDGLPVLSLILGSRFHRRPASSASN